MDDKARAFLETNRSAAMITLRRGGMPHVARVAVALVDGKIWSSGTQTRLRTKNLRRDPRSTLFVFGEGPGFPGPGVGPGARPAPQHPRPAPRKPRVWFGGGPRLPRPGAPPPPPRGAPRPRKP